MKPVKHTESLCARAKSGIFWFERIFKKRDKKMSVTANGGKFNFKAGHRSRQDRQVFGVRITEIFIKRRDRRLIDFFALQRATWCFFLLIRSSSSFSLTWTNRYYLPQGFDHDVWTNGSRASSRWIYRFLDNARKIPSKNIARSLSTGNGTNSAMQHFFLYDDTLRFSQLSE